MKSGASAAAKKLTRLAPPVPGLGADAAPPPSPVDRAPQDFDRLVRDILKNPDILHDEALTADDILEIQKRLNPYAGIAGPPPDPERKRVAACCYTNLREDYLRRLTMTSLVGFVFQLLHEWEVPAEKRRWVPAAAKKKAGAPAHQPFDPNKLVERLEATLAVAREAQAAAAEAAALGREAAEADLCLPAGASPQARAAAETKVAAARVAAAKAAGLLYAATHVTHGAGAEAGGRLSSTAEAGMKFPEVKEILGRFPLPPPPGQAEMPPALAKGVIGDFLAHWFVFDPSVHVRAAHDAKTVAAAVERVQVGNALVAVDSKDPGHLTLEAVRAAAPEPAPEHRAAVDYILASPASFAAVAALLRDPDLPEAALAALEAPEAFRQYLLPVPPGSPARPAADNVPPQDTFHRWSYYTEVNYEALRTISEALYPERPDLDWAIALWDVFEGPQPEVDAAFEAHCKRYQDEVPSSIRALEFGGWSLLADFGANREKLQFYNKHTEVLKRILDRHAEDKRIGAELMRNRVRQAKAKNIAEDGPDAAGLKAYRAEQAERGLGLGAKGVEKVIGQEEMRRLEKAGGSVKAAQELELLEQTERRIQELAELEELRRGAGRELALDDRLELATARAELGRIREMVAVPDGVIQVDVFSTDPATGDFAKTHFYSKAEAPDHVAAARQEAGLNRGPSDHPALAAARPGELPAFAPFAVEHILRDARGPEDEEKK
jgi:hypothetical protein